MFCSCPPQKKKAKPRVGGAATDEAGLGLSALPGMVTMPGTGLWVDAAGMHVQSIWPAAHLPSRAAWGSAASNYLLSEQIKINYSIINSARGAHEPSWEGCMLWFLFHRPSDCPARQRAAFAPSLLPSLLPLPSASPSLLSPLVLSPFYPSLPLMNLFVRTEGWARFCP